MVIGFLAESQALEHSALVLIGMLPLQCISTVYKGYWSISLEQQLFWTLEM